MNAQRTSKSWAGELSKAAISMVHIMDAMNKYIILSRDSGHRAGRNRYS